MLKQVFKICVALLAIAAAATGPARAQNASPDVTLDFTSNDWNIPTSNTMTTESYTDGTYSITLSATYAYKFNSGYLLLGKSGSYLQLPAFGSPVEKIEVVGNNGASAQVKQTIYVGETEVSTQTTGATGTNTYVIDEDYRAAGNIYTLKVESAHNTQITYIKVYYVSSGGGSTPEPQTVQLTLASNNSAMGYATVALHPEYELYDTYTTSSSTSGTKTSMWTTASVTDGAWINTTESNTSFSVNPNYGITIHHVTFYNANNQSVEVEPNDGNSVYVQLKNGNVYNDDGTQLLLSGGITRVEAYGMEMSLPAGVTATETAGVYDVVPGTQVPVAAVAKRHYQLNNWSNNATTDTVTVTVNAAMTLTANFVASPVLTLVANNAQMGRVEIPRHQGNGFLCEFKAVDYAGQQQSLSGMHEKFYFNTPSVAANSTVWTNNDDYSYGMSVNPEGFGHERNQCRVVFVGPNGETYEFDFSNNNNPFAEVYLKSGNTYSDNECNNLLWQGGVASIECYGPGLLLPDGVAQITDNTYSVLAGTQVPVKATAKLRYHFVNWSNNSTEAQTTFTMPATAATLTANFVANPTLTLTATPAHGGSIGFDFTPTPQTLTVNDGTVTNYQVPIYMNWLDNASTRGQYIIPAEQLGLMAGGTLNSITYYHNNSDTWTSSSQVNVYLKEVENTILTEYVDATTATTVYTGTLTEADGQMTINFSEPYTYQGGNLLVGFDNTSSGNFNGTGFYGVDAPSGSSAGDHDGFTAQSFLPKSTFNYTPALPAGVIANSDGTYSVAAGTELTLKANAAADYTLGSWSNQAEVNANATQTLTMPAANLTIGATFVGQPYTVRLAEGTEDAAHWSLASGGESVTGNLVLENVMSGSELTATYNGSSKKVKSVKAVKYVAPVVITWNSTNVFNSAHENENDMLDYGHPNPLTFEGITISKSGGSVSYFMAYYDQTGKLRCYGENGDSFTFTAPSGKKFTKIEIINNGYMNFDAYGDWTRDADNKIVWSGTAANAVTLGGTHLTDASNLNSIVFTLIDAQ